MDARIRIPGLAAGCIAGALGSAPASADNGTSCTANSGSACERYLRPDVLAAILVAPAVPSQRIEADTCHTGSIYIQLTIANLDVFKQELPPIVGAHSLDGVGDAAFWSQAGALSAVKRPDCCCDINVVRPPTKIRDEARAHKLGEICNKLFALP